MMDNWPSRERGTPISKASPVHAIKAYGEGWGGVGEGEVELQMHSFLTSAL